VRIPGGSTTAPVRFVVACASARARIRPSGESSCAAAVEITSSFESCRLTKPVVIASSRPASGQLQTSSPM